MRRKIGANYKRRVNNGETMDFCNIDKKTAVGSVVSGIVNWYKGQVKVVFYILTF